MNTKSNQIHSQIKIDLKNITKIEKYKILIMTEYKKNMNITKKLHNNSMTEHQSHERY